TVACEGAHCAEVDEEGRRDEQIDTASEREVAIASTQALAGKMYRDERRRTRRIKRERRAPQVEHVRNAPGGDAQPVPSRRVHIAGIAQAVILHIADANKHTSLRASEAGGRKAAMLERFPNDLEQESLLRVHRRGLARRDAEELRIELINFVEET